MYPTATQENSTDTQVALKDQSADIDSLLDCLADGRLAQRISEAAHLAVAEHMFATAQDMQSPVEAENSAE